MLRVEDEPRVTIMGTQDPKEAWDKLDRTYGSRLANNRTTLMSELVKMRYDGSGILEFKGRMDTLRLRLIEAGQTISDSDFLSMFMGTLPEEFDVLATTIDYNRNTVEDIVNRLRQSEIRKEVQPGFSDRSAFYAQRGSCGTHFQCPRGRGFIRGNGASHSNSCSNKCYECGEAGHWARNCPKRKNNGYQGQGGHSNGSKTTPSNAVAGPSIAAHGLFSAMSAALQLQEG
jgi:hypothetical protein